MKFGDKAPDSGKNEFEGKPAADKDSKIAAQNTAELNRIKPDSTSEGAAAARAGDDTGTDGNNDSSAKILNDTGTDAPTVDSNGNALPGTDGNAAVDSIANRQQELETAALDNRINESADLKPVTGQTYQGFGSDPSAADLGLKVDDKQNAVERVLAESAAATAGHGTKDDLTIFSSHPIQNLHLGPYHFEGTVLKLAPDQVGDFEKLLDSMPLSERMNVRKLSLDAVDAIVESRKSSATQQFDSSTGRDALAELQARFPKIGTTPIDGPTAHANVSQTDNNMEIPLSDAMNNTGNE